MKSINRVLIYLFGLFIITIGINLSIISGLGVSPVSAFILPLSQSIQMNLGVVTTLTYIVFVLIQKILLKSEFHWKNVFQIPFSIIFGYFINFGGNLMSGIICHSYFQQMIMLVCSIIICAIGATCYMTMDIVPNPPEGLQLSICKKLNIPFSKVKLVSDCLFVTIGIFISILFLGGITSIREGTIIAALCTGKLIGFFSNHSGKRLRKIAIEDDVNYVSIK